MEWYVIVGRFKDLGTFGVWYVLNSGVTREAVGFMEKGKMV